MEGKAREGIEPMDGERAEGEPASAPPGDQCRVVPRTCPRNGRRALWGEAKCRHGFRRFRRRAAAGQRRGLSDGLNLKRLAKLLPALA
jgi:hypothetical protein